MMDLCENLPGYDKEKNQKLCDIASENKDVVIRYSYSTEGQMDFDFVSLGVKWKDKKGKFFGTLVYVLTNDFLTNPTRMIEEFRKNVEDMMRKNDKDNDDSSILFK
jgi:hypothetical protein